jgi:hypothetical protein
MLRKMVLAALLSAAPTIASAEVVFVGTIINVAVTPQCQFSGAGDRYPSVFHPKITGNENFSGLSWIRGHYAVGHLLGGIAFDTNVRTVETGGVGWGDTYFKPAAERAQIRISSSVPAIGSINTGTQTVILNGQIKRPFGDPGGLACVITFRGTYVKDPFEVGS